MTDHGMQTLIVGELRMIGERLARLETHVESLVGNGQPGRLTLVENKVSELQHWRWKATGIYTGASAVISAVVAFLYHLWK